MATEITMPKLSDTMTEGSFIGWRKSVGERIERGDVIAEVETDKAVMELEAFASGVLLQTMFKGGETVPVGTVLGLIGDPGELAVTPAVVAKGTEAGAARVEAPPVMAAAEPAVAPTDQVEAAHDKASPLVRRLAREQGIDLSLVHGSGPEGRILREDLPLAGTGEGETAMAAAPPSADAAPQERVAAPEEGGSEPGSAMRRAISATVSRSWREIPHFSVTMEISMDGCREVVEELKGSDRPLGYHALVIKACAAVLPEFPLFLPLPHPSGVNISFAVALPDGLLMPVIRDCHRLSAVEIEQESARLAERARNGRMTPEEMSGGHFSVSNLGMWDVDEFTALIMPGQTAILALGAVRERPVARGGHLALAPTMRATLSCDHRSIDGAYAASFLAKLRVMLEHPVTLLVAQDAPHPSAHG